MDYSRPEFSPTVMREIFEKVGLAEDAAPAEQMAVFAPSTKNVMDRHNHPGANLHDALWDLAAVVAALESNATKQRVFEDLLADMAHDDQSGSNSG